MSLKRDARKIAKGVEFLEKLNDRFGPQVEATGQTGNVTFGDDGPPTTKFQRSWVKAACEGAVKKGILAEVPDLPDDLSIGQAEGILTALGAGTGDLYKRGRDQGVKELQATWRASR